MLGQEESIMAGLEFNSTNQLSLRSIDTYKISEDLEGAKEAFFESDYGAVAVQFDGSQVLGQKTFCMSYALADLKDNARSGSRNELLSRILNFFDVVADVDEVAVSTGDQIRVYPNPTSGQLTVSGLPVSSEIVVTDLTGTMVMTRKTHGGQITLNISELPKGIYLIRSKNGVKKIVKM
jgi:hypothetical protein